MQIATTYSLVLSRDLVQHPLNNSVLNELNELTSCFHSDVLSAPQGRKLFSVQGDRHCQHTGTD